MIVKENIKNINFRIIIYAISLNILGIFTIISATGGDRGIERKQLIGMFVGIFFMILISVLNFQKIYKYSYIIYIGCVVILLSVLLFGFTPDNAGATRWINIPVIGRVQPSEFVKCGIIIFLADILDRYRDKINDFKVFFSIVGLIGFVGILILLEPDLSTTIVLFVISAAMFFVAGLSYKWIFSIIGVLSPLAITFVWLLRYEKIPFLKGYQAKRILAFIYKEKYADANLQQANSIMAIGSGGLHGKGLNTTTIASVKNGNFLTEEQTDFIFAIIGEELGFIGTIFVVTCFALLVYELFYIASKLKNYRAKLICIGSAMLFAFQSFTNIAVATGVFPNTGLPLPFVSYGVSSLLSLYIVLGFALNSQIYGDYNLEF